MKDRNPKPSGDELKLLNGHRARLHNRYLTQDHDSIDDSRMLELFLTYSLHRRDVYPIALRLLDKFGDLDNVLSASVDELACVKGVGAKTATLLSLPLSLMRKAKISKNKRKLYKTPQDIATYFCTQFDGIRGEQMAVATFNNSHELLSLNWVAKGHPDECIIDMREVARVLVRDNVAYVAFAHNHPSGNIKPSAADIETMFKLKSLVEDMSVKLIDMFIVSGQKYFLMSRATELTDRISDYGDEEFSYTFGRSITYEAAELAETVIEE